MARPKRSDDLVDRDHILAILKLCRRDLALSMARMQIGGPLYNAMAELLGSIDMVALVLTNSPDRLHDQPHRTP